MERNSFLIRFVFLDGNSFISDAHFLIDVPASVSLTDVKREIEKRHEELHSEAEYVESLERVPESEWSEKDKEMAEHAEETNPYLFCPAQPEPLLNYVCKYNKDWSFSRPQNCFNLSHGIWA